MHVYHLLKSNNVQILNLVLCEILSTKLDSAWQSYEKRLGYSNFDSGSDISIKSI